MTINHQKIIHVPKRNINPRKDKKRGTNKMPPLIESNAVKKMSAFSLDIDYKL